MLQICCSLTFGIDTSTIVFNKLGNYWEFSYFPTNLQLLNIKLFSWVVDQQDSSGNM